LLDWLEQHVPRTHPLATEIGLRLRVSLPLRISLARHGEDLLLDAVDLALSLLKRRFDKLVGPLKRRSQGGLVGRVDLARHGLSSADFADQPPVKELSHVLELGGSVWRVAADGGSLERRIDPTVTDAMAEAASSKDSTADHLAAAWQAAYGRHPDPSRAYSEAIKAVEAAAAPMVLPTDRLATLGKIIGTLRQAPGRWELVIPKSQQSATDISVLIGMLELLWRGQTDRHGGIHPTRPIPQEAGPAAVHLAVLMVQWFRSGVIRRRGAP
jgi:hypothetical protein